MTLVEGDEMQRLWGLVADLSAQLSSNRELCERLQAQAEMLKGQAHHNTTGFSLRRFNVDISREKFESTLEKTNAQLVLENQSLAHENKQLSSLLREYEVTLETVMRKFRSFSHATQSHTLALTSHYDTLLSSTAHASASAELHASTELSSTLAHLGSLVRLALRAVDGEVPLDEEDLEEFEAAHADPFALEGYRVGSPSGVEPSQPKVAKKPASRAYGSAAGADSRWVGSGGYTGRAGDIEAERSEDALERLTEEERLRSENEALRQLLEIKEENERKVLEAVAAAAAGHPLPEPTGRRPSLASSRSGSIGALGLASSGPGQYGMPTVSLPKSGSTLLNRYTSPVSPTAPASLVPSSPPKPPAVSLAAVMSEPVAAVERDEDGNEGLTSSNEAYATESTSDIADGGGDHLISLDDDEDDEEDHLPPRNAVSMGVAMKRSDSMGHHMLRPPSGGEGTPMDVGALGDEDEFEAVPDDDDEQEEEDNTSHEGARPDSVLHSAEVEVRGPEDRRIDLEKDATAPQESSDDRQEAAETRVPPPTDSAEVTTVNALTEPAQSEPSLPTPTSIAEEASSDASQAEPEEERDITSAASEVVGSASPPLAVSIASDASASSDAERRTGSSTATAVPAELAAETGSAGQDTAKSESKVEAASAVEKE